MVLRKVVLLAGKAGSACEAEAASEASSKMLFRWRRELKRRERAAARSKAEAAETCDVDMAAEMERSVATAIGRGERQCGK